MQTQSIALLLAVSVAAPGCQLLHATKPVTVMVRDAETKQPIADAKIDLCYLYMCNPFAPPSSSGKTDRKGCLSMGMATLAAPPSKFQVEAQGYMGQRAYIDYDEIAKANRTDERGRHALVFDLFSGEAASVELVVDDGFRGLVKVEHKPLLEKDWVRGKRNFVVPVPRNGIAEWKAPKLLMPNSQVGPTFTARTTSGEVLRQDVSNDTEVSLRHIWSAGPNWYYVVGTKADEDDALKQIVPRDASGTSSFSDANAQAWERQQRDRSP